MDWKIIDKDIHKYIEYILLPNLIAFSIYKIHNTYHNKNESFIAIYNTIKSYINIIDENPYTVYKLVIDLLKKRYHLEIVNLNPLILKDT